MKLYIIKIFFIRENDQIVDSESREETFHHTTNEKNIDNEKMTFMEFGDSIKESKRMINDEILSNKSKFNDGDDMIMDIANAMYNINDNDGGEKNKEIKIKEENVSILESNSKSLIKIEEINNDNDVIMDMANAMTMFTKDEKELKNEIEIKIEDENTVCKKGLTSNLILDSNMKEEQEEVVVEIDNEEEDVLSFFILDATEEVSTPGNIF